MNRLTVSPEQMMAIAESYGIVQIPPDRFIPAGKDVGALEALGRAADEAFTVSGSYDLAEQFVQLGDADFQLLRTLINFSILPALPYSGLAIWSG
jgi:hypothetical protein